MSSSISRLGLFVTVVTLATGCGSDPVSTGSTSTLTVTKAGNGTGTITSAPAGISCGATCTVNFRFGTVVTLTAAPAAGSSFAGWSGPCTGTGTCVVTVNAANTVTATFTLQQFPVTVTAAGTGAGTVTSAPAGIDCGATCTANYDFGTVVTLTAAPSTGSTFAGWSGAGCTGTGTCVVTVNAASTVTATFALQRFLVTVIRAGTGAGTVTSAPAGIDCGADCTENYNWGTAVTLTAAPSTGSTFAGWSGAGCTGTGTCVVTVNAASTVTATFTLQRFTLTVTRAGNGTGTVTSVPAGITCGTDCTEDYNPNTSVVLTAAADPNSVFTGWAGGGCSGTGTCTTTITAAVTVTATFNAIFTIGHATQFSENSIHGQDFLLGEQIVVPSAVTLRQFGVIVITGGPQVKMALYTNSGGAPGTLVAQTAATTMVPGNMQMNTTAGFIALPAGTYWIMAIYSAAASVGYTSTATTNVVSYQSLPFASALPSPFGAPVTYTGQSFNYYLVVH